MVTIQKTYVTVLESVTVLASDRARAMVAIVDTADSKTVAGRRTIEVKAGKLVDPQSDAEVDPAIAGACATLLKCFSALSDKLAADYNTFFRPGYR